MTRATVVIELDSDGRSSRDLAAGGVFVPGCALRLAEECDLVVCGANHQILVHARVVYVDAQRGAGLELIGFSSELKAQLAALEPTQAPPEVVDAPPLDDLSPSGAASEPAALLDDDLTIGGFDEPVPLVDLEPLDDLAIPTAIDAIADTEANIAMDALTGSASRYDDYAEHDDDGEATELAGYDGEATELAGYDGDAPDTDAPIANTDAFDTLEPDGAAPRADDDASERDPGLAHRLARNVHERLRGLSVTAQLKVASTGELHERIVLERLYGKTVWETLLRNPRLSPPEVSRIARYGALPRVLLEIIVGNNAWLQVPEVRRALLSNPRLAADQIVKVLRLTPKHELKLAAIQTAYPQAVRNAARTMLRGD